MYLISEPKNKPISYSEGLSTFLTYLRDCDQQYKMACEEEKECADATQDILHFFELEKYNRTNFARMAHKQKEIRERRRKAKDIKAQIEPVKQWFDSKQPQVEKDYNRYRVYVPKNKGNC